MKPGKAPGVISFHVCNNRADNDWKKNVIVGEVIAEDEIKYQVWFEKEWTEIRKQIESP